MTGREATKGLKDADMMALAVDWAKATKEVRRAYMALVRLMVKYGGDI